jgi:recombination protein RecR
MQYSGALLEALIAELTVFGLGRKSAQRIAFHLLRSPETDSQRLASAIIDQGERPRLLDLRERDRDRPCALCADPRRDSAIICVVEQPMDVLALERTASSTAATTF